MSEDFRNHFFHYLILFLILLFGFLGFWYFSYNPVLKRSIILTVTALYIAWGVIHHYLEKNLNFKIMVEYTLVAALAAAVLLIMMGNSA